MRHDRTGELVDEDQADEQPATHHCRNGWIDRDGDLPRPCLVCKPHLAAPVPRQPPLDLDRIRRGIEQCRRALRPDGAAPTRARENGDT